MNKQTQEALKMAIEAMENIDGGRLHSFFDEEINACKEALEQPAQEPKVIVSPQNDRILFQDTTNGKYMMVDVNSNLLADIISSQLNKFFDEIYTHPHQWQGLTDDEIVAKVFENDELLARILYLDGVSKALKQALKEKNYV